MSTLGSRQQCEHRANVQCWSTCDGEMCVVSRQSQLLCLCHGGGVECGELDCIKSRDNCTVNGVEQHLETFVCIIEYFPSAPVVSMSAPGSRLLECGGWHPDNLSSVTRVRCPVLEAAPCDHWPLHVWTLPTPRRPRHLALSCTHLFSLRFLARCSLAPWRRRSVVAPGSAPLLMLVLS